MSSHLSVPSKFLKKESILAVISAAFSYGAPLDGAQQGPSAILNTGIFNKAQSKTPHPIIIEHTENTSPIISPAKDPDMDGMKRPRAVSTATQLISQRVYEHARWGSFVLSLGGDHSVGIGTVSGTARAVRERFQGAEMAVVWVDAHADVNTPVSSMSGRIHGMPVAFVSGLVGKCGEGDGGEEVFGWIGNEHLISLKRLVYIGLRDVDDAEKETIQKFGVKAFWIEDVKRYGVKKVMDLALEYIGNDTPIHVSYDIDSLDPDCAPSTGFPVAPGLSLEEGKYIAKRLHESGNMIAMDLVEINPQIESDRLSVTVDSGCAVINSALGI